MALRTLSGSGPTYRFPRPTATGAGKQGLRPAGAFAPRVELGSANGPSRRGGLRCRSVYSTIAKVPRAFGLNVGLERRWPGCNTGKAVAVAGAVQLRVHGLWSADVDADGLVDNLHYGSERVAETVTSSCGAGPTNSGWEGRLTRRSLHQSSGFPGPSCERSRRLGRTGAEDFVTDRLIRNAAHVPPELRSDGRPDGAPGTAWERGGSSHRSAPRVRFPYARGESGELHIRGAAYGGAAGRHPRSRLANGPDDWGVPSYRSRSSPVSPNSFRLRRHARRRPAWGAGPIRSQSGAAMASENSGSTTVEIFDPALPPAGHRTDETRW
jgi:hypothetical protein